METGNEDGIWLIMIIHNTIFIHKDIENSGFKPDATDDKITTVLGKL